MKFYKTTLVRIIYFFGLALMISALPLSKYFMSIAQFVLAVAFLWEGINEERITQYAALHKRSILISGVIPLVFIESMKNLIRKFRIFFNDKPALAFSSIFLIHIIGLTYTVDFNYAISDLRTKVPLLLLPLFISTSEKISGKAFRNLLLLYIAAVVGGTIGNTYIWLFKDIADIREISVYVSHIRFSINICLAIFISWYFILKKDVFETKIRFILVPAGIWLIIFLFILNSLSGIFVLLASFLIILIFLAFRQKNRIIRYSILFSFFLVPFLFSLFIYNTIREYTVVKNIKIEELDKHTPRGGIYQHDTAMGVEDGRYLGLYLCYTELKEAWNQLSSIDYDSTDRKGQQIRYTLIRFMSSKNYRKDLDGVARLTDEEVHLIENGIANVNYLKKFSLKNRIRKIILAYHDYQNKGLHAGYSSMERIVLMKASLHIIKNNFLTGVGTGDIKIISKNQLSKANSPIQYGKGGMFSSHNQFLNITVLFGIFGLIWFIFALLYPPIKTKLFGDYFFLVFFTISILSMLSDDTLKTQAGVTFIAFFYSFFLFSRKF